MKTIRALAPLLAIATVALAGCTADSNERAASGSSAAVANPELEARGKPASACVGGGTQTVVFALNNSGYFYDDNPYTTYRATNGETHDLLVNYTLDGKPVTAKLEWTANSRNVTSDYRATVVLAAHHNLSALSQGEGVFATLSYDAAFDTERVYSPAPTLPAITIPSTPLGSLHFSMTRTSCIGEDTPLYTAAAYTGPAGYGLNAPQALDAKLATDGFRAPYRTGDGNDWQLVDLQEGCHEGYSRNPSVMLDQSNAEGNARMAFVYRGAQGDVIVNTVEQHFKNNFYLGWPDDNNKRVSDEPSNAAKALNAGYKLEQVLMYHQPEGNLRIKQDPKNGCVAR